MRILAVMPVKDEADRYLQACLSWLKPMVDGIFVYDDRSTDDTVELAASMGASVAVRSDQGTSFLEHEGRFRGECWQAFERFMKPEHNVDWVLAIDADEFLVDADGRMDQGPGGVLGTLRATCISTYNAASVILPIPEVFMILDTGRPLVRKDGYWGSIRGTRLFRYFEGGKFQDKPMGCGSEPHYVGMGRKTDVNNGLNLMHYGYADEADRVAKYQRYSALLEHGHDARHIQSILQVPSLDNWSGMIPKVWRGKQ